MRENEISKSFLIKKEEAFMRADLFLIKKEVLSSRSKISKLFQNKKVRVNKKYIKASYRLRESDALYVNYQLKKKEASLSPHSASLDIVFEDEALLVLNKPAGLVVHPGAGCKNKTLVNILLAHKKKLSPGSSPLRPGIVHRLDKETSGLMLAAKTKKSEEQLISCFKNHEIQREYHAITLKPPRPLEGKIESWLKRHPIHRKKFHSIKTFQQGAKKAITFYKSLKEDESGLTWIHCQLKTGRTHQIRVHLSSLGSPLLGDKVYGRQKLSFLKNSFLKEEIADLNRIALHAFKLRLKHPRSKKKLLFQIPWPDDLKPLLKKLNW